MKKNQLSIFLIGIIFNFTSCVFCKEEEITIKNNSNTKIAFLVIEQSRIRDDSIIETGAIIQPNQNNYILNPESSTYCSSSQNNNPCFNRNITFVCYNFYDFTSTDTIHKNKLLLRKDWTVDSLKANNWVITYP